MSGNPFADPPAGGGFNPNVPPNPYQAPQHFGPGQQPGMGSEYARAQVAVPAIGLMIICALSLAAYFSQIVLQVVVLSQIKGEMDLARRGANGGRLACAGFSIVHPDGRRKDEAAGVMVVGPHSGDSGGHSDLLTLRAVGNSVWNLGADRPQQPPG